MIEDRTKAALKDLKAIKPYKPKSPTKIQENIRVSSRRSPPMS